MNGRAAGLIFLLICVILSILLLTKTINSMVSAIIFAIALVILGVSSKGFKKDNKSNQTQ